MLTISKRGLQMPASPIRKLVPYAEAAKKKGIKVYHLNIGQPDIETPKQCLDAVRQADFKVLEYSHSAGNESYRKKLVQYYKKVGINVTPEQIIITTGGSEAIIFGFTSFVLLVEKCKKYNTATATKSTPFNNSDRFFINYFFIWQQDNYKA